jgi:hypothetical protein
VLAPILLLLNQDPLLFRGLSERRRYFPPVLCTGAYLSVATVSQVLAKYNAFAERSPFLVDDAKFGTWFLVKNLGLLALTLPNHVFFLMVITRPNLSCAPVVSGDHQCLAFLTRLLTLLPSTTSFLPGRLPERLVSSYQSCHEWSSPL